MIIFIGYINLYIVPLIMKLSSYLTKMLIPQAAHATLMRKIISSDQDLISVVLFNTRETKNPIDFAHVYILQELERPGAEKVLMLEKLIKGKCTVACYVSIIEFLLFIHTK